MPKVDLGNRLRLILRGFRHRNYRLYFTGQGISLIGTWMQTIAMAWLVYRMTGSAFWLGLVAFSAQIPSFFVSPVAGVLADRWDRRKMLYTTQALAMLQAFTLAWLYFSGNIALWNIIPLSIFLGVLHAFDIPARQAFLLQIVGRKEDLGNAIALNSSMFNAARLLGPPVAGVLIAVVGEGVCFLINALSFSTMLMALAAMKVQRQEFASGGKKLLHEFREGLTYAYRSPIRSLLGLVALLSFLGMPYSMLMPVFAKELLGGGSSTLGMLVGCSGLGAMTGALYLASRRDVHGLEDMIGMAAGVFGTALIALSLSRILWVSMILMYVAGFGMMVTMASCNTLMQTLVDDNKRGRVMSLYAAAFMGTVPLGNLVVGSLATVLGAPNTLLLGSLCCVAGAIAFAFHVPAWRRRVHPIYRQKGILPELPEEI